MILIKEEKHLYTSDKEGLYSKQNILTNSLCFLEYRSKQAPIELLESLKKRKRNPGKSAVLEFQI